MEFVPILVLGATVKKIVDLVRFARVRDLESIVVQILAWVAGVGVTMLAAHTAWSDGIIVGDQPLAGMNVASQILAGIALGSAASLAHDLKPHPEPHPAAGAHRKG